MKKKVVVLMAAIMAVGMSANVAFASEEQEAVIVSDEISDEGIEVEDDLDKEQPVTVNIEDISTVSLEDTANIPVTVSSGEIEINETNFPDAEFRSYISSRIDSDSSGTLSESEIASTTKITVYEGVSSLQGIEFFTSLTYLSTYDGYIESVDLSKNTALTYLCIGCHKLSSLDVSKNTALEYLYCYENNISDLDLSNNTALIELNCSCNNLTSLDVSNNTKLEYLNCSENNIAELDVGACPALKTLYCSSNNLRMLDISNNTSLTSFVCSTQSSSITAKQVNNTLKISLDDLVGTDNSNNVIITSAGAVKSGDYIVFDKNDIPQGLIYNYYVSGNGIYRLMDVTVNVTDKTVTQEVETVDLSSCSATLSAIEYTYDGTEKTPDVTVTNGSTTLTKGTDYTVSYSNNINAGTATVTISGAGSYIGAIKETFTINKASQSVAASIDLLSISVGSTAKITASGTGTITYSCSDGSVASVDADGIITGLKAGSTAIIITASGDDNTEKASTVKSIIVTSSSETVEENSSTPTGTKLSSVKNKSSKKIVVKWTKVTDVSGYQIQYSTSKTFAKNNKTVKISGASKSSKTISKLKKGKTYYVRIRTYKTVSGKTYYSDWSSKKKVKISK